MWLPTDERRLLAGYYNQIGEVAHRKVYRVRDLRPLLKCCHSRVNVPEYGDTGQLSSHESGDAKNTEKWIKKYFNETKRIERANRLLAERGLIVLGRHDYERDVLLVELTLDGYDLGRKYSCILTYTGLWFEEYRNHWLWLIVAFFGGAIGSKLIDFIASIWGPAPSGR